MAQTLPQTPQIHFDLGAAVASRLQSFSDARSLQQSKDEAAFQTAVADNTLSPDAAVKYREQMLSKAESESVPDQDYITSLRTKLASAKTIAHNSKVITAANEEKAKAAAGLESNQAYLEHLQTLLGNENDPSLMKTLQEEITSIQGSILDAKMSLISSEASKGATESSVSQLTKALGDAQDEKALMLASGNADKAAALDVTIGAINQNLTDIRIDNENNGLNINKSTEANPIGYLKQLQNLVATSDATTPIKYQGVGSLRQIGYPSEQAYWQSVLGNYLSTTFISELTKQYNDYVNAAKTVNGLYPTAMMDQIQSDFAQLSGNPVLSGVAAQIQQAGIGVLGNVVKNNANAILDNYTNDNDANSALNELSTLSTKYGIDTTAWANRVVAGAAKQTSAGISAINSIANQYMTQDPTMSSDAALAKAISDYQTGKGGAVPASNKELAGETPGQAVKPPADKAKAAANTPPVTVPVPSNKTPTPAQQTNQLPPTPGVANSATTPVPAPAAAPAPAAKRFTGVFKTANNATVYGTAADGKTVAFENPDQLKAEGFSDTDIKTVKSAPSGAVNYSNYNPSPVNPKINP